MSDARSPERFISMANVALGALAGLLISGPAMSEERSMHLNLAVTLIFISLGTIAGYKRRRSRGFLYLSLLSILVLSSLMLRAFTQIQQ